MIEKEYLANRITNANDAELVAITYEGLINTLNDGIDYIDVKAYKSLNKATQKSREILAELLATLKGDSEVASNLKSLYVYTNQLITEGEIQRDPHKLQTAIKVLTPLYEGWKELGEKEGKKEGKKEGEKPNASLNGPKIVAGMTYGKGQLNDHVINNESKWEKG